MQLLISQKNRCRSNQAVLGELQLAEVIFTGRFSFIGTVVSGYFHFYVATVELC